MAGIEKANLDDIPQLCELLTVLFTQEVDFRPDPVKHAAGLSQIIGEPKVGCILVSRDGPVVAGMINVLYSVSTVCGGRVAIFEDMVVRPEKRGNGLGSTLLRSAIDMVRSEGCLRAMVMTDRINTSAIRFYQRQGFLASDMMPLRLSLQD
jgi:GNAT superfamily N-acetyltransferase